MYKIVYSIRLYVTDAAKNLEEQVNKLEKEGWTPQGGVCSDDKGNLFQAMVKKEK